MTDGFPLICEYDPDSQKYQGIIVDIFDKLSEKTGIQFEYTPMPEGELPWEYAKQHPNTILAPFLKNSLINYDHQLRVMDAIVQGKMLEVKKSGTEIDHSAEIRIALPSSMYEMEDGLLEIFPKAQIVFAKSHQGGLDMVDDGRADMTLVNEISGAYMLRSPYYENLSTGSANNILEDITIALSSNADPTLLSIMDKAITSFSERDARQIVVDNTVKHNYQMTFEEWIYKYKVTFFGVALAIGGFLCMMHIIRKQKLQTKEEKHQLSVAEERHKVDMEYQRKMFYQANFDALTGLYNKNYFVEKANERMKEHPKATYTFFWINVSKFKMINESYGQRRGDQVLCAIADKLRAEVGKEGLYCRIYSDHFCVCYPVCEERLKDLYRDNTLMVPCDGQDIYAQMDVGVFVSSEPHQDANQSIEYAQIAFKNRDKVEDGHFYFYKEAYLDTLLKNQKITNEMEQALEDGQFHVFLQPQFNLVNNRLVGAEALVRWIHPTEGVIRPDVFIPVFESNGFIYKLDAFVCESVCKLLAKWKSEGKLVPVSVNLSRIDLQNASLIPMLRGLIDTYEIPIQYLHLEITESAYVDNHTEFRQTIGELRKMGFIIEMDDFGSGYSSLNMLKDIPVNVLKLDMKFFDGETHMDRGGNIIQSVVNLAHSLGILVVAEGVETSSESNFLQFIKCHIVQGYLYGHPVAVGEFEKLLAESKIGRKALELEEESQNDNVYWRLEKYNVLLKNDDRILFDYDPVSDYATFTYIGKNGKLMEKTMIKYLQNMSENIGIHPDWREKMREKLQSGALAKEEFEFFGKDFKTQDYEWFQGTLCRYFRDGILNREIALFKKKA